jgi:hypothetical protein
MKFLANKENVSQINLIELPLKFRLLEKKLFIQKKQKKIPLMIRQKKIENLE